MFQNKQVEKLASKIQKENLEWTEKIPENEKNFRTAIASLEHIDHLLSDFYKELSEIDLSQDKRQLIDSAVNLVFQEQGLTLRKDATLYPYHPLEVGRNLITDLRCTNSDLIIGALLHDIEEDTEKYRKHPEALREQFGSEVQRLVHGMTNKKMLKESTRKYMNILQERLGFETNTAKAVYDHIEYQIGVKEKIEDKKVLILKSFDFATNIKTLANIKDEMMKSRLANKYCNLIPLFIQEFQELIPEASKIGIDPQGVITIKNLFQDLYPEVKEYSGKWKYHDAQVKANESITG